MLWTLLVIALVGVAIYFSLGIASCTARRKRLEDRANLTEKDWLDRHAPSFEPMERRHVLAGLRMAGECLEVDVGRLLPDDRWNTELASHPTFGRWDPARKDWDRLAGEKGFSPGAAQSLTLRDYITHYGSTPAAGAFIEDDEKV